MMRPSSGSVGGIVPPSSPGSFTDTALAAASAGHLRACALLVLLCLACFLPGFASLQPMDRDEPRFAQASKQMLETGDLVDIRFQGEARHKKPVGIYWAQAASVAFAQAAGIEDARDRIAFYRVPSLIGALASVLLAYWAALAFLDRRGALLAAALFGACLMLSAEARLAKTDALLTACATASFGALARLWLDRAWLARPGERLPTSALLAFWLGMALGILVKGPMVPLFVGLPVIALSIRERSWRWLMPLRPILGLGLVLVAVAPWFAAIAWKTGGAFFSEAVGHDMLAKVGGGSEKHFAPPGAYLVVFFATFWPGAPFAALAVPFAWRERGRDTVALLLAWIVPAWILFEIVPTKLPHYVLPLMPAVAILTVSALQRGGLDLSRRGVGIVALLVPFIPVGLTLGLAYAAWTFDRTLPWAGLPLLVASCAVAILAWLALVRGRAERGLVLAILASALLSPAVFGLTQPALPALKVSPRLAAIRDALLCRPTAVASLGYREPSLVFLIGTDLAMLNSGAEAVGFLGQGGCRLVFVEGRYLPEFEAASKAAGTPPASVGHVTGFNINGGRKVDLQAYAVSP